jgi:hypothetical protein
MLRPKLRLDPVRVRWLLDLARREEAGSRFLECAEACRKCRIQTEVSAHTIGQAAAGRYPTYNPIRSFTSRTVSAAIGVTRRAPSRNTPAR